VLHIYIYIYIYIYDISNQSVKYNLIILIVCLYMANLTEVFPFFFPSVVRQMPG